MFTSVKGFLKPYEIKFNSHDMMFKVLKETNDIILKKVVMFESYSTDIKEL